MSRKRCHRRVITPMPPRGLRPMLDRSQVLDLGLVHASNLDAIARGQGNKTMLWHWVESVFTWSKAAELLGEGVPEMTAQLLLAERLVLRYGRTGRVAFDGPDYQLAKRGLQVMDALVEKTDQPTAFMAADWSCRKIASLTGEWRP